jgi:hypothetical protein
VAALFCLVLTLPLSASSAKLLSLRLLPEDPTLWGASASQRLVLLGLYADGIERDVTSQARSTISDDGIAFLEEHGRLVAAFDGTATLRADFDGETAETRVTVAGATEKRAFSFGRDIGSILTKRGCNTNDCHGSVKGKGGFKLSANALYPREDYKWIVEGGTYQVLSPESKGPKNPRVDLKKPQDSLLLLKPIMGIPHGGGQKFSIDSTDYETIVSWIRQGVPFGEKSEGESVRLAGIEVQPSEVVLDAQGRQQLLVTARLSNGRKEDITSEVLYVSNNREVVDVSSDGVVSAVNTGETAVMIRAAGFAVSTGFGVISEPLDSYPEVKETNFIDQHVFAKLRRFNIIPSRLSNDQEFLRRICLDLTGTLPPPERVREFLAGQDPNKREKLIETLLDTPEYIDYWTFRFADVFRVGHFLQPGPKFTDSYWEWVRDNVERNRPYDQVAMDRIGGQGTLGAPNHYFGTGGELPKPPDMMAEQIRVFFGRRLDCAQCHNHPYENWSQDQFWQLTAFFGQLTRAGDYGGDTVIYDDPEGHGQLGQGEKTRHPRTKEQVEPAFLDGTRLPEETIHDPRLQLAQWMVSHPNFAQAAVNRIWSYFFGRGIVDPVDDFRLTNHPTHPELLEALAQEFRDNNHDVKRLIRLIVQSRTYQLSSEANETNQGDTINYSHRVPRPLDAEVLLDAISQLTGVPETYEKSATGAVLPYGIRAINIVRPDAFPTGFLNAYGQPSRQTVPARKVEPNLPQALHVLAGATYNRKVSAEGGRVDGLVKSDASNGEIVEELYLAGLSRLPSARERSLLRKMITGVESRRQAIEDLMWGVIASREFAYNH